MLHSLAMTMLNGINDDSDSNGTNVINELPGLYPVSRILYHYFNGNSDNGGINDINEPNVYCIVALTRCVDMV